MYVNGGEQEVGSKEVLWEIVRITQVLGPVSQSLQPQLILGVSFPLVVIHPHEANSISFMTS